MEKDKENLFESPTEGKASEQDDDATAISSSNNDEGEASGESVASSVPEWLHVPKLTLPTDDEEGKDTYYAEDLKPEPSKYSAVATKKPGTTPRQPEGRVRRTAPSTTVARTRRQQETHISYRRDKKRRRRLKKHWVFKIAIIFLPVLFMSFAYKHRATLGVLAEPLLLQLYKYAKYGKLQTGDEGDEGDEIGITSVSDDSDADEPPQLLLHEMECHDLMPRAVMIRNISELEFEAQFAIAECYYLRGDYLQSYRLLQKNKPQLRDESLLLYTILLLKRRQFKTVRTLLQGKCVRPEKRGQFFPCLAQSLLHMTQLGHVSFIAEPSLLHQKNPYSAITWLLKALRYRTYDASSDYVIQATSAGERSNRRVALSYVYETLMRFTYLHGSTEQLNKLHALTVQKLRDEHAAASWWVRFLTKLRAEEVKKREVLHAISSKDNFSRMYDNFDFLNIIGIESIYLGYSGALEIVINRIWQYQRRTWNAEAREAVQFLEQWKTRILVARKRYRDVIKNLKNYANNYGKDYFYCFFRGIALMNMMGKNGAYKSPTALLSHSLSLRDSWDNNYAYALVLLKSGKTALLANHMDKLKRMAITPLHKKWLFLLRAEIKISSGKHDAAITDLRGYIAKHPHSFTAHRLLVAAYRRANRRQEAIVVRKAYDRLQKRVPYYSTTEGMSYPLGPFALL